MPGDEHVEVAGNAEHTDGAVVFCQDQEQERVWPPGPAFSGTPIETQDQYALGIRQERRALGFPLGRTTQHTQPELAVSHRDGIDGSIGLGVHETRSKGNLREPEPQQTQRTQKTREQEDRTTKAKHTSP
jgi:hypothetical protein